MNDEFHLERFGRHVPNILKRQLIANLAEQFISQDNMPDDYCGTFQNIPSVSHFHGALLFVDISGFTVLSQRLPVDELRTQINSYFRKIIDIVDEHGGDVIKFAGDALFIVWQTVQSNDEATMKVNMQQAGLRALRCGLDINFKCGNYPVPLKKSKSSSSHAGPSNSDENVNVSKIVLEARSKAIEGACSDDIEYTYLNVHSGLSMGSITGIDVGAMDRWEFFIIGQPLRDVAEAEASAGKGQLAMSAFTHNLLCSASQNGENSSSEVLSESESILPCGCIQNSAGCFRIPERRVPYFENIFNAEEEDDLDRELRFYEDVMKASTDIFASIKASMILKSRSLRDKLIQDRNISASLLFGTSPKQEKGETDDSSTISNTRSSFQDMDASVREEGSLQSFFLRWVSDCLRNDFARHVHEADRVQFSIGKSNRTNAIEQFVHDQMSLNRRGNESSVLSVINGGTFDRSVSETAFRSRQNTLNPTTHSTSLSSISGSTSTSSSGSSNFVSKIRTLTQKQSLRDQSHAKHERALRNDSGLNGELRNVIVLFIAVHGEPDLQQPIPHRISLPMNMNFVAPPSFNFTQTPFANRDNDKKLLAHYLSCMDVIVRSLKEYGGQLRQFIVDDKGTVSIGTFGLRGSTNVDNAAAAIEAAMSIIHGLQGLGLNSSIGITAGPAYCGIVGSLRRHEYAVMGPSVNLSARLMGKAKKGEILCDSSIRNQDRAHHFKQVGEVQAKGFALPVAIFKPNFTRASVFMDPQLLANAANLAVASHKPATPSFSFPGPTSPMLRHYSDGGGAHTRGQSGQTATLGVRDMHLFGRDAEIELIFNFLFDSMRLSEFSDSSAPDVNSQNASGVQFEYCSPCRCSSLNGSSGIGKSAVLEHFAHISRDLMVRHNANVSTFFHPCSSLDGRDPYKSWKTVLRHMFARISRLHDNTALEQPGEVDREKLRDKWLRGAMEIVKNLPPHLQQLLPLLSVVHIIPGIPETKEISALSGAEKLKKVDELLQAIILEYPKLTKTLTVILLDDVHLSDAYSMLLFMSLLREGRGITFLITWNLDLQRSQPEEQKLIVEENEKVFEGLKASEKVIEVPIVSLSFESLKAMVSGVLLKDNIIVSNDEIFQRLAEITGGNPLYAYELAKAVVDKYKLATAAGIGGEHSGNNTMLEIIDSFKAHRVEEVIFYRLDRLEPKTQMLLKLASVACASGSSKGFSLEMIATILKGNYDAFAGNFLDQLVDVFYESEETKKIMKILAVLVKSLVDSGEFLKILHDRNRSSFSSEKSIASNTSILDDLMMLQPEAVAEDSTEDKIYEEYKDLSFDFKIGLERNMIYELMLEDQKESLHDRVATFLEKKNSVREYRMMLSSNDLLEEAFHWERAKIWTNALSCYYRAALALEDLGAFTGSYRYYAAGFRCFTNLQKAMGENLLSMLNCDDSTRMVSLMMRTPSQGLEALISAEECNEYVLYRHAIYRVVAGDESLLTIIVRTITKFAQGAATLEKNAQITLTLYREALQLIFFTWKHRCLQDMYSSQVQHVISAAAVAKQQVAATQHAHSAGAHGEMIVQDKVAPSTHSSASVTSHQLEKQDFEKFGLPDMQLIFPVLSGIASMYRIRRIPDDEKHSKESLFYDAMVVFASQSSDHFEHQLQAMCLLHSLALESENYPEAQALIGKITELYDYDKYSALLVSIYGNDRVPYTMAMHAQLLILLGQLPAATLMMQSLMQLVPRIVHLHSMGILAISLSTALIVMGKVEDACRVFEYYYSYEQSKPKEVFSFFRDTNPVMATWHKLYSQTLLLATECSIIPQTSAVAASLAQLLENDEVMDKIVQKGYFFIPGEKRPLLYDALASFGACLEYIAAEILSMMALIRIKYTFELLAFPDISSDEVKQTEVKLRIEETKNYLQLAVEYIDLGLHVTSLSNKLKFPYLLAVLAKVKILLQIDSFHDRVGEAMKEHSFLHAVDAKVPAENGTFSDNSLSIVLPAAENTMEQSVALLLQEIEAKGTKFQMPFMSFAAVILNDVIFGDEDSKNRFKKLQQSFAMPATNGGKEIHAKECMDSGNDEEKQNSAFSNDVSLKSVTEAVAGDVALTSKVAAAAMHLSGIDMQFVKVLEESLPHFWCGSFHQRKKRFNSSSITSNSIVIAATVVNTN